jgi:hypothetical protein
MGFQWQVDPYRAFDDMFNDYAQATFAAGRHVAYRLGPEMLAWAKQNAVWKDRTTDARTGLSIHIEEAGPIATVTLYHGPYYGLWLEIAMGGKYAIIAPAIHRWGPEFMRGIQGMINLKII